MNPSRIRSLLLTAALLALCGLGWFFLAPTQIGGSTSYMITHGTSMEPMLHTGDLVLVRPADDYRVGQVVAYHSTLLHTVVLHRIIRISHGRYTFKGDHNGFIDPTHPTRALLVGGMWLHIPDGGIVLDWVHRPWVAALLLGGVTALLLLGGEQQRRRRRRGRRQRRGALRSTQGSRPTPPQGSPPMPPQRSWSVPPQGPRPLTDPSPVTSRQLLAVCTVLAALFAALGVYALVRPTVGTSTTATPYTQRVSFGYHGHVHAGPVYPSGVVTTGDPLYSQLVHRLTVTAAYQLTTPASYRLQGTVRVRGKLSNSSGWSRSFWLGPPAQIVAGHALATARISLPQLNSLSDRVSTQIGPAAGEYTLAIEPQLSLDGEVAGQRLSSTTQPSLSLSLDSGQLLSSTAPGSGLVDTTSGSVTATSTTTSKLAGVPLRTVRLIGLAGFALFALLALLLGGRRHRAAPDPVELIASRYKHLIVPVSSVQVDPEHPPIEVRTIEALAQLAERSERLILHDHRDDADDYLVDDQGTLFRFQALPTHDTGGNGRTAGHSAAAETVPAGNTDAMATASDTYVAAATSDADAASTSDADAASMSDADAASMSDTEPAVVPDDHLPHGIPPLNDPAESAQAIRLSGKVTPDLTVLGPEIRRPPAPNYAHWSGRPEVRVGFTLAPLLTLLAWRHVRSRHLNRLPVDTDEPAYTPDRLRGTRPAPAGRSPGPSQRGTRPAPQRGPGDRRRGERRRA